MSSSPVKLGQNIVIISGSLGCVSKRVRQQARKEICYLGLLSPLLAFPLLFSFVATSVTSISFVSQNPQLLGETVPTSSTRNNIWYIAEKLRCLLKKNGFSGQVVTWVQDLTIVHMILILFASGSVFMNACALYYVKLVNSIPVDLHFLLSNFSNWEVSVTVLWWQLNINLRKELIMFCKCDVSSSAYTLQKNLIYSVQTSLSLRRVFLLDTCLWAAQWKCEQCMLFSPGWVEIH